MKLKTSPIGASLMRTRVARSNFAASRSKISARRPERFAGESRKIRLFATAFEGDIVSNIQGERSEFKKAAQNRMPAGRSACATDQVFCIWYSLLYQVHVRFRPSSNATSGR